MLVVDSVDDNEAEDVDDQSSGTWKSTSLPSPWTPVMTFPTFSLTCRSPQLHWIWLLICWMDRPYILCCLYRSATGARAPSTTALGTGGLDSSMSNIFPKLQFITCEFKRKNLSQLVDVPWSFLSRHLGRPVRRVRPSFNINTIIKKNIVAMQAIEDVWLLSNPDHQEHKSAPMEVLLALTSTQSTF